MPDFSSRINELRSNLERLSEDCDPRVIQSLKNCLDQYGPARQSALEQLVDIIARASPGNADTQRKWKERIDSIREQASRLFGDAVREMMLPGKLQLYWFGAVEGEESFWTKLSACQTADLLDKILAHQNALSKFLGELQDKWTFLLSQDKNFENDELRALREADRIMQETVAGLNSNWDKTQQLVSSGLEPTRNVIRNAVEQALKVDEKLGIPVVKGALEIIKNQINPDGMAGDPTEAILGSADFMISQNAALSNGYRAQVETYKSLVATEKGSVLNMFRDTRRQVSNYQTENNLPKAAEWMNLAKASISNWAGDLKLSGQQSDANVVRDEIIKLVDADWTLSKDLDQKFREKFSGVFVDALGNTTIEEMAEQYLFEQQVAQMQSGRPGAKVGEISGQIERFAQDKVEPALTEMESLYSALPDEVRSLALLRHKEFKSYVTRRIRERMQATLPQIMQTKELFDPSSQNRDFSRAELVDQVKSS